MTPQKLSQLQRSSLSMGERPSTVVRAWRPNVAGVAEVLHASFPDHAYPSHTHGTWTLLIVDTGVVRYGLDRAEFGALTNQVTVLPPHVPHDGRTVDARGFRKRVVYLEADQLDGRHIGHAVDHPGWADRALRDQIHRLHTALAQPGDGLEAESRLTLVRDRLARHLDGVTVDLPTWKDPSLARRLRDLLDAHTVDGLTLEVASTVLGARPTHLIRCFTAEFGIAPHRYLTGRRLDDARRRLLAGQAPADIAVAVGFYDQAHLTRHFRRLLGVTPAAYARSA